MTSHIKNSCRRQPAPLILVLAMPLALALGASQPVLAQAQAQAQAASAASTAPSSAAPAAAPVKPPVSTSEPAARRVLLVTPTLEMWSEQLEATGNVMPWQEIRVGTEIGGLRLLGVQANAGDVVKKGQVLALLNPLTVEIDLDAANAQLMEAQAALAQAEATLERGKRLAPSGGVSQQELMLYETQKQTASARLNAARAQVKTQKLRLDSATVVAPDDGVISSRSAVEGAIVAAGSELFRLIRQGRLEWRAEVKGETLIWLRVGQQVTIKSPLGADVKGQVRQVSPTIDLTTRNGLVYVDLPRDTNLKAGLSVSGTLVLSKRKALVLPSSAVLHEGERARVFKVDAAGKVYAVDVVTGRVQGEREEITAGLDEHASVIASDVKSLKIGESVDVAQAEAVRKVSQASPDSDRREN